MPPMCFAWLVSLTLAFLCDLVVVRSSSAWCTVASRTKCTRRVRAKGPFATAFPSRYLDRKVTEVPAFALVASRWSPHLSSKPHLLSCGLLGRSQPLPGADRGGLQKGSAAFGHHDGQPQERPHHPCSRVITSAREVLFHGHLCVRNRHCAIQKKTKTLKRFILLTLGRAEAREECVAFSIRSTFACLPSLSCSEHPF